MDIHTACEIAFKNGYEKGCKETTREILNEVDKESNGQTKQITDLLRKRFRVDIMD